MTRLALLRLHAPILFPTFLSSAATALLVFVVNCAIDAERAGSVLHIGALGPLAIGAAVFVAHLGLLPIDGCGRASLRKGRAGRARSTPCREEICGAMRASLPPSPTRSPVRSQPRPLIRHGRRLGQLAAAGACRERLHALACLRNRLLRYHSRPPPLSPSHRWCIGLGRLLVAWPPPSSTRCASFTNTCPFTKRIN